MVATHTPGPRGWPLFGNLYPFAGAPLAFFQRVARDYGDVARFPIGRRSVVLFANPSTVDTLLVQRRDDLIHDVVTRELSSALGEGLLTAEGEVWKRQRKLIAPSFTPKQIARYADAMVDVSLQHLPLADGPRDIHHDFTAVTLDIVVRTLFGAAPSEEATAVGPLLDRLMGAFERENRTAWRLAPKWVPAAHRRTVNDAVAELDRVLGRLVARARAAGVDDGTLLGRLLAARDDDGRGMDDRQLRDELLTIFLAGHETTALALSYSAWLLAEHPEVQQQVHEELDAVLGGRRPTAADARALPILDSVVKEALRLYPPAWAFGREPTSAFDVDGHPVHPGDQLIVSPWVLHRDPRWWIGADRFRPVRWRNGEADAAPKGAYLPFGGGPRVCVGQHFAMLELVLVLATWLSAVRFTAAPGYTPDLLAAVTLRPRNGVRVGLQRRSTG